ncbi:MAG TPA: hypothetical protein VFM65_08345 [Flavobacteriaceae bacterium]|nr:hypothetical protein [Flavobacteriaceae bacterium]
MKKTNILLAFGAFLISSIGFAQTDTADLNVVLTDIQSITVAAAQETVTITLDDVTKYTSGTDVDQADHLAVVSTSDFDITAVANQELTKTGEANTIPVSTVTLTASAGTNAPDGTMAAVALSATAPVNLVTGASADLDAFYNVNYAVSGGTEYLNQPTGTYETTITYTLVPQ